MDAFKQHLKQLKQARQKTEHLLNILYPEHQKTSCGFKYTFECTF